MIAQARRGQDPTVEWYEKRLRGKAPILLKSPHNGVSEMARPPVSDYANEVAFGGISGPPRDKGIVLAWRSIADHLQDDCSLDALAIFPALSHEHAAALMASQMGWGLLKRESDEVDGSLQSGA